MLEDLVAGLIFFLIAAICYGCCRIVDRFANARLSKKKREFRIKPFEIALLIIGLVGVIAFIYSFVEPYQLETTFIKISSKKLKKEGGSIRIVHLTDLHCTGMRRNEERLPTVISSLKPDLIVFSGDAADSGGGLKDFKTLINELAKIAPVYGVGGNHDSRSHMRQSIFTDTKMTELSGEAEVPEIKGNRLWINGVSVDHEGDLQRNFAPPPKDIFSIFLYHYPSGISVATANKIDLFCTGHTHGGQVRLPIYGALITMSPLGKKYEYGLYKVEATNMFVSRGVGMTALPIRFLAPPEIAVIDVVPE